MKALKLSLVACALMGSAAFAGTDDPALDLLIEKLVEKGALKIEDAADVTADMKKAVAERNKTLAKDKDFVKELMGKNIGVTAKAKKIEFSGTHYLGFTSANPLKQSSTVSNSQGFEMRRNYVQAKAYINDSDYLRVTLDATKELASAPGTDAKTKGYAEVFVKYAYLWLDKVLPYTGAEIGIAHRPWIDYEEHNGWYYRSFNKVALEHKSTETEYGPDLVNSADFGVNFKTKTDYFTSEIGIFNGEGYHADKLAANQKNSNGLSAEWRLTVHPLGDGAKVGKYDRTKDEYLHVSTYGLNSKNHKDDSTTVNDTAEFDRAFYGIHAVYNQPKFLIAGQYFSAKDSYSNTVLGTALDRKEINGWSINGEFRPVTDWTVIGRYDHHEKDEVTIAGTETHKEDAKQIIYGVAYKYNKNVTFIASGKQIRDKYNKTTVGAEKDVYMLTTEVKW